MGITVGFFAPLINVNHKSYKFLIFSGCVSWAGQNVAATNTLRASPLCPHSQQCWHWPVHPPNCSLRHCIELRHHWSKYFTIHISALLIACPLTGTSLGCCHSRSICKYMESLFQHSLSSFTPSPATFLSHQCLLILPVSQQLHHSTLLLKAILSLLLNYCKLNMFPVFLSAFIDLINYHYFYSLDQWF